MKKKRKACLSTISFVNLRLMYFGGGGGFGGGLIIALIVLFFAKALSANVHLLEICMIV
jgi:hypothetical protein